MATEKNTELAVPTTKEGLQELLKRAQKGDKSTLPVIRKLLDNPYYIEMFGGNLPEYVEESFIRALTDKDLAVQEAVLAKLNAIRKDLLGSEPTPIERLLVERVAACWLQVQDAEIRYVMNQKDMTFRQAEFHQKRMDATHRRYLAAIKALALVRKLALPALQINVAQKQMNLVTAKSVNTKSGT